MQLEAEHLEISRPIRDTTNSFEVRTLLQLFPHASN